MITEAEAAVILSGLSGLSGLMIDRETVKRLLADEHKD